jgi:hypothetical protein
MTREKTIAVVSCTKESNKEDPLLYKSLLTLDGKDDPYSSIDYIHFYTNNKQGLCKKYNEFLEEFGDDYDIVAFVHDDVFIDDGKLALKLIMAHELFDIVGVAGGINPLIKEPALWHLMCGGFGPNLRGFAGHYLQDDSISITSFGPTPSRVAIADGLFLSVNTQSIKRSGWKFNENYTFHHYDISSCLDANKKKLKVGVYPILLYHMSPGLKSLNDPTFLSNQAKFMKEYSSY